MADQVVNVQKMTRKEFRESLADGKFKAAIIPTGSIEQHLEHLAMEHDIRSSTWVAEQVAQRLYPQVVVGVPMNVGISEHHMPHKGTLTAKPGSWMTVLFDAVDSFVRHGIHNVLILNGHGGNEAPMYGILRQWQLYFQSFDPDNNVQFHSYWNLSRADAEAIIETRVPGHATEYETAMALALFPENVRHDAIDLNDDKTPQLGTIEKGQQFAEFAVARTVEYVQGMLDGRNRETMEHRLSRDMDPGVTRRQ